MPLVTAQQFQAPSVLQSVQQGLAGRGEIQRQGMLTREEQNKQRLAQLTAEQEAGQLATRQRALGVPEEIPEGETPLQAQFRVLAEDPAQGEKFLKAAGLDTDAKRQEAAAFAFNVRKEKDPKIKEELIAQRVRTVAARGGDPADTMELFDMDAATLDATLQGVEAVALTALQRGELGIRQEGLELKKVNLAQDIKKLDAELKQSVKKGDETKFDQEGKLRNKYTDASKEFVKSRDANDRILASLEDPSAAGDLALVFNFMKLLDPGSTVREGEFANAQNSGGVSDITRAKYNSIMSGERLSTNIRKDFETRSKKLFSKAEATQDKTVSEYSRLSNRYGLDPENVIIDLASEPPEQSDLNPAEQTELEELRKRFK